MRLTKTVSDTDNEGVQPCFLDIEASSLDADSYPIEIGWSNQQGDIESHLINPYFVEAWTDWDFCAQAVHGISRKLCRENGKHPVWVYQRLNRLFPPGSVVYADGGPFDQYWLDQLFAACTPLGYAQINVQHSDVVMLPMLAHIEIKQRQQFFEKLKQAARSEVGASHRAGVDVQYLITLYRLCQNSDS